MAAGENPLVFEGLYLTTSTEESRNLNTDFEPKVIISASGMCDAGRIRHHLKYNLWRPECMVLFVGYQAVGTLGRYIFDGAKTVKLFGDDVAVNAEIEYFPGISGHADRNGLLDWISGFAEKPTKIFVNHGDEGACEEFARCLREERGLDAYAPFSGTEYDLGKNEFVRLTEGVRVKKEKPMSPARKRANEAFQRLVDAVNRLAAAVRDCEGMATKDLAKLTDRINAIIEKIRK